MIVDWFIDIALEWIIGMIGFWPEPEPGFEAAIVSATSGIQPVVSGLYSLGVWIPWGTALMCLGVVSAFYFGAFLLRIFRALISHVPFIGGGG